ncbi:MAG: DUF2937 family protein [Pseudomonadota bacterium]
MGIFSKSWVFGWAGLGLASFSQAPEFSQQYQQRLGGAINELASVVSQFDKDARAEGLTREEALDALKTSKEDFPRRRGLSMERVINRFDSLVDQGAAMETATSYMQPVHLLRSPDQELFSGTVKDFKPGVQLTAAGLLWGGLGAGLLGIFGRAPISYSRYRARKKREPRVTPDSQFHHEA